LSYSQSGEDMIVRFVFDALRIPKPFYVDVGAHDPFLFNNTAHFYCTGCRGINIEPNPVLIESFRRHRKGDVNLNIGVADHSGELDFYIMSAATMSTFSKDKADELVADHGFTIVETKRIRVRSLADILAEYTNKHLPDFLSLDAEGLERQILESVDFRASSPLVICCETVSYATTGVGKKDVGLIEYVKSRGYMVYADTHINTIFVLETAWRNR